MLFTVDPKVLHKQKKIYVHHAYVNFSKISTKTERSPSDEKYIAERARRFAKYLRYADGTESADSGRSQTVRSLTGRKR